MTDMVERVARALHAEEWRKVEGKPAYGGDDQDYWEASARAAITAVRESIVREMLEWNAKQATDLADYNIRAYAREHNINLDSTQG